MRAWRKADRKCDRYMIEFGYGIPDMNEGRNTPRRFLHVLYAARALAPSCPRERLPPATLSCFGRWAYPLLMKIHPRAIVLAAASAFLLAALLAYEFLDAPARVDPVSAVVYGKTSAYDFRLVDSWVWRANLDGSRAVPLAPGHAPVISPDGRWIAFLRVEWTPRSVAEELRVMTAAGERSRVLRRLDGQRGLSQILAWSPDSRKLLVSLERDLVLIDRDDGGSTLLVAGRDAGLAPGNVSFAPTADEVAFDLQERHGIDVFVVPTTGGTPRRLTSDGRSSDPVWGRDGIAFARSTSRLHGDIWLMDANGRNRRRVTKTDQRIRPFAFSADGRRLLAYNPPLHNGRLWAVDVASGRARDLTGWVGDLFPQAISDDGRYILAAIGCGGMQGGAGVVEQLSFATGKRTAIARGPCRASWNA